MSLIIPEATRPAMKNYGISEAPEGLMSWEWVREQITKSHNYWICTTRADNRPHAAPVWGVVYEDIIYFGTGATSVKGRNIAARPDVVVHLESGDDCVVIEGRAELFTDMEVAKILSPLYGAKYKPFTPSAEELVSGGLYRVSPHLVMAWKENDFPKTATRWVFRK